MGKKIKIKQHDLTDCGPACLASISSYYERYCSIAQIRLLAGTNRRGTNLKGLMEAAKQLGFDVKGVKGKYPSLYQVPKPAIAHLITDGQLQHFVVIYQIKKNAIKIMDPATGRIKNMSKGHFSQQWTGVLLLLTPRTTFKTSKQKMSILMRFWLLLKPHKTAFLIALLAAITYGLLGLSTSIYLQKITDQVLFEDNLVLLNKMSLLMLFLVIIQLLIGLLKDFVLLKIDHRLDSKIILEFYARLLQLPQQFFDNMQLGELISRMNDAIKIRYFINQTAMSMLVNVLAIICAFSLMLFYYWKLAMVTIGIIPTYFIIYLITRHYDKKTERKLMQRSADFESQMVESLGAIRSIKSFGLVADSKLRAASRFQQLLQVAYRSSANSILSRASLVSTTQLFTIGILWIGSYFTLSKKITPGELLSFYAIIAYITTPISSLISSNKSIHHAFIAADRLFEIMDLETHENSIDDPISIEKKGDICFRNVSFRYGSRSLLFHEINCSIVSGCATAIIGESGSGKSTLMALVQRLYPIQAGSISIAGVELNKITLKSLRNHISVVPQRIELFTGSILENIAIGDEDPDVDRIVSICNYLGILPFIKSFPQGFDTLIGNNGARLSGGQKQRLAIARALYKSFEVLILDEPTSSLDSISKKFMYRLMKDLKDRNKTVVIIAHHLGVLKEVDSIIFIDKQHRVHQGTHQELYRQNESFRSFWKMQMVPS